jgi:enamine deaminase RidA (YjgF/YER057c/UK114 family)
MPVEHRDYPDIAPAGPTYSRGTRAGNMLFISGCTARGSGSQGKPLMDQLEVTLERVVGVVKAEGGHPGDIAKITCFVTSIADWTNNPAKQAELFERFFEGQYPANSLIEISALAEPGLDVEIEAIAVLG